MSLQERGIFPVPHHPQVRPDIPMQEKHKSPEKGSQRHEAVGLGQKRAADSPAVSNIPAKFLRQRTLSASSTSSSSSAGSGSPSSSSSSFTGMEDNVHLSSAPLMVSPLPPDGCPKSPVNVQETISEVSITKVTIREETTSALPPAESLNIQDTDSVGPHPKSPVHVQETPSEVLTAEVISRKQTISALPYAKSQHMQVKDSVAKHPKSQETLQSPEDVSQVTEGAALPQGGAVEFNETQEQQAPESPRQVPEIIPPEGRYIPLVSSVDEELQADRTAKFAGIQQLDAEKAKKVQKKNTQQTSQASNIETETARERASRLRRSSVFSPLSAHSIN